MPASIRLRRPRNDPLGLLSGRGGIAALALAAGAPHEEMHRTLYCFTSPPVSRRLTAYIGGYCRLEDVGRNLLQPMHPA